MAGEISRIGKASRVLIAERSQVGHGGAMVKAVEKIPPIPKDPGPGISEMEIYPKGIRVQDQSKAENLPNGSIVDTWA